MFEDMYQTVIDLKLGKRVPNTLGLTLQDGFKEAQEIIWQDHLANGRKRAMSWDQRKIDAIWAEQVIEEQRLKKQMERLHSRRDHVAPVSYIITDWDEPSSIQMTIRNTQGESKRYSVTYKGGDATTLRQQLIDKVESLVKFANQKPYEFWR